MLQKRLVGALIVKGGIVVQSVNFARYLPVGSPVIAIDYLNRWGIDEITLLDIDATPESRKPDYEKVWLYARHAQVPLSVGGGITEVDDIKKLIQAGADKVVLNSAAVKNPRLLREGAARFGNQSIVVSIDAKRVGKGKYMAFTHSGRLPANRTPAELAKMAESEGAGEIFLNSIDRDGSKAGYDLELIEPVARAVNIPLVVCGGVGHPRHFLDPLRFDVSGVAAANFFHYTEHSVIVAKSFLKAAGAPIRLDSYATYAGYSFDDSGRASKLSEDYLERLRFENIPEEII